MSDGTETATADMIEVTLGDVTVAVAPDGRVEVPGAEDLEALAALAGSTMPQAVFCEAVNTARQVVSDVEVSEASLRHAWDWWSSARDTFDVQERVSLLDDVPLLTVAVLALAANGGGSLLALRVGGAIKATHCPPELVDASVERMFASHADDPLGLYGIAGAALARDDVGLAAVETVTSAFVAGVFDGRQVRATVQSLLVGARVWSDVFVDHVVEEFAPEELMRVCGSASVPARLLERLATAEWTEVRECVAKHRNTPAAALISLAGDADWAVASLAVANPVCPPEALIVLTNRHGERGRLRALDHLHCPAEVREVAAADPDVKVRLAVAASRCTSFDLLERLLEDAVEEVRWEAGRSWRALEQAESSGWALVAPGVWDKDPSSPPAPSPGGWGG